MTEFGFECRANRRRGTIVSALLAISWPNVVECLIERLRTLVALGRFVEEPAGRLRFLRRTGMSSAHVGLV